MLEKSKPFKIGDKVFGKVKGYPAWPAKITDVNGKRYSVIFYGTNETATLKHENIVYYLKNKQKFSNLQKRKYFAEAIIDIEEDIKNCGGLDGSPQVEETKPEIPVATTAIKASSKRKRRALNATQSHDSQDTASDSIIVQSNKRLKIEDQNHNEADITSSGSTISTTQSKTESDIEVQSTETIQKDEETSESISTNSEYLGKHAIPSTIAEVTENDENDEDEKSSIIEELQHDEPSTKILDETKDSGSEEHEEVIDTDTSSAIDILHKVSEVNLTPPVEESKKKIISDIQLDLKDIKMLPDVYLTSIITYAQRVGEHVTYYKNLRSDPVSLDDASDTRLKVLPVKIDKDNYAGLIYVEKPAEYFNCEFDRAIADAKICQELLELRTELINGNHGIADDRVIRNLGCDDSYVHNTTNLSIISYKKSKLQWLQQELEIFQHIVEIKKCLGLSGAHPKEALEHMRAILHLPIEVISLKKRSSFVNTVRRLCKYVGSPKAWDYTEEETANFEDSALLIRQTADAIYNKVRGLFEYGHHDDFVDRFKKDCDDFNEVTKHMTEAEIFSLCAEPRSRKAELELIFDDQAINVLDEQEQYI